MYPLIYFRNAKDSVEILDLDIKPDYDERDTQPTADRINPEYNSQLINTITFF